MSENDGPSPKQSTTRHRVVLAFTYLISFASLYWVLRDVNLAELRDDLATMGWKWVGLAAVVDVLVYFCHAWRWGMVLRPLGGVRYWDTLRSIYVGLFANEVLPLRVGEVIRCYLLGRWMNQPFSVLLSSFVIERVFDGIWLMGAFFLALKLMTWPRKLNFIVDGAYALGVVVLAGAVLLGIVMFQKRKLAPCANEPNWRRHLRVLMEDLNLIGHSRYLYFAGFGSLPYLLIQVLPVYLVMKGFGLDLGIGAAVMLTLILRLGAAVPQAPGNIGLFQFLATLTLRELFQVDAGDAARFSLVLWAVVTLPLVIGGFIALLVTGSRLDQIRAGAHSAQSQSKSQANAVEQSNEIS